MTSNEWRQGASNALICGSGVALAWVALVVLFTLVGQSVGRSVRLGFSVVWGVTFVSFLGRWLHSGLTRGQILLDCGPHPSRWLFVVNSLLTIIIPVGGGFAFPTEGAGLLRLIFALSFGSFWLILAFGRLQVTKHGIWQYWELLPRGTVGSYRWTEERTLLITPRRRFLLRGAFSVPPEQRHALDCLLAQFCGRNACHSGRPPFSAP